MVFYRSNTSLRNRVGYHALGLLSSNSIPTKAAAFCTFGCKRSRLFAFRTVYRHRKRTENEKKEYNCQTGSYSQGRLYCAPAKWGDGEFSGGRQQHDAAHQVATEVYLHP